MEPYEMWLDSDWVRKPNGKVVVLGHPVDNPIAGEINPDDLTHLHNNIYRVSGPIDWY